ncbi:MAG: hypothetical protein AB7O98_14935 [Hyphomonadaceae bacterium]
MKVKIQFDDDTGQKMIATFDMGAGTVSAENGKKGTFTRRADGAALDLSGDWNMTLTFAGEPNLVVGHTRAYSRSDGGPGGKATVIAVD